MKTAFYSFLVISSLFLTSSCCQAPRYRAFNASPNTPQSQLSIIDHERQHQELTHAKDKSLWRAQLWIAPGDLADQLKENSPIPKGFIAIRNYGPYGEIGIPPGKYTVCLLEVIRQEGKGLVATKVLAKIPDTLEEGHSYFIDENLQLIRL